MAEGDTVVTRSDVDEAATRLRGLVRTTPMLAADTLAGSTWFKLEFLQHTGTFKARGALNRLLVARESGELDPAVGIAVASGGNAGIANAYAAAVIGVPATVFVPETTPPVKIDRLRHFGAIVVQRGREYAEAQEACADFVAQSGAVAGHAYDQPAVVAGAGTVALELARGAERQRGPAAGERFAPDELPAGFDTIVVAVGGGGLMAGVAAAEVAKVVAVEPVNCPTLSSALTAGQPVDVSVSGVAVDALGARRLGAIAFDVATRTKAQAVLVSDDDIMAARRSLWANYRIAVEPGAATALAAITSKAYVPAADERVAIVLCGANADPADL